MSVLSPNDIERLRREAKKRARTEGIIHAEALDLQARAAGFNNWATLKSAHSVLSHPVAIHPTFSRTADEMKLSFRKFADPITPVVDDQMRSRLPDLSSEYSSPMNALEYAKSYIKTALALPRYSPSRFSIAYVEMRIYLPYTLEQLQGEPDVFILLGRDYKPLGMTQKTEHVEYEKYKNLHVRIPKAELEFVTRNPSYPPGYLYVVGPQFNREHAESYRAQLGAVMSLVAKYS